MAVNCHECSSTNTKETSRKPDVDCDIVEYICLDCGDKGGVFEFPVMQFDADDNPIN